MAAVPAATLEGSILDAAPRIGDRDTVVAWRGGVTVRAQDLKTRLPEDVFGKIREMHPLLTPKLTNATIKRAVRDYIVGGARKQRVVKKYGDIRQWDVSSVRHMAVHMDPDARLDDLCEAVTTLEEIGHDLWTDESESDDDGMVVSYTYDGNPIAARRVLGGEHPFVEQIERSLQGLRAAYDALLGREDRVSLRFWAGEGCPACGHGEAFFKKLQIRSAPWPQYRTFYRCCGRGCGHRWKEEPSDDESESEEEPERLRKIN